MTMLGRVVAVSWTAWALSPAAPLWHARESVLRQVSQAQGAVKLAERAAGVESVVGWLRLQPETAHKAVEGGAACWGEHVRLVPVGAGVVELRVEGAARAAGEAARATACGAALVPRRLPRVQLNEDGVSWGEVRNVEALGWAVVACVEREIGPVDEARSSRDDGSWFEASARGAGAERERFELKRTESGGAIFTGSAAIERLIRALAAPPRVETQPTAGAAWATAIVDELVRAGVERVVACPGSRSTPLALAAIRHPRARLVVVHDERAAGFFAVGHGKAGGLAAVVTTSGTASSNLLPSAAEAAEDGVPVLYLTADRQPELRGVGADQVLASQRSLLEGLGPTCGAKFSRDLPPPDDRVAGLGDLAEVSLATSFALHRRGPAHLNLAFRENLAPRPGPVRGADAGARGFGHADPGHPARTADWDRACVSGARFRDWDAGAWPMTLDTCPGDSTSDSIVPEAVADVVAGATAGVVVVGRLPECSTAEAVAVAWIAGALDWPVVHCDPQAPASCRARLEAAGLLIPRHLLGAKETRWPATKRPPDAILQLGASCLPPARVKAYLDAGVEGGARKIVAATALDAHATRVDDDGATAVRWRASVHAVARAVAALPGKTRPRPYSGPRLVRDAAKRAVEAALGPALLGGGKWNGGLSEPTIARLASASLSAKRGVLFASNSMAVRDVEAYGHVDGLAGCFANRGLAGIDGVLASACGVAAARPETHVSLLIGDQSLLHDLSSLRIAADCVRNWNSKLKVVVVNNRGGAIFSFLPVAQPVPTWAPPESTVDAASEFEPLFGAPHDVDFCEAARSFGLRAVACSTVVGLRRALADDAVDFVEAVPALDRRANAELHAELDALGARATQSALIGDFESTGVVDVRMTRRFSSSPILGNDERPVLVALHGLFGSRVDLADVAPLDRDVLFVDLPGHGASGPRRMNVSDPDLGLVMSFDAQVAAVAAGVERALGRDVRYDVLGYSLGARLALGLKKKHPGLVNRVVAVSANLVAGDALGTAGKKRRAESDAALARRIRALKTADDWRGFFDNVWYASKTKDGIWASLRADPQVYENLVDRRLGNLPEFAAESLERAGAAASPPLFDVADSPDVTLVYGAEDTRCAASAAQLQNVGRVVSIPNSGHALPDEAPAALAALVARVLSGCAGETDHHHHQEVPAPPTPGTTTHDNLSMSAVHVRRFDLPLRRPPAARWIREPPPPARETRTTANTRLRGVLLVLEAGERRGIGEASPCAGVHDETVEDVEAELETFARKSRGATLPKTLELDGGLTRWIRHIHDGPLSPSARFAVESALVMLLAPANRPLASAYAFAGCGPGAATPAVPIASLIDHGAIYTPLQQSGGVVKLKVASSDGPAADAANVDALARDGVRVRADANRRWSLEQARDFADALTPAARAALEFLEEPCRGGDTLRLQEELGLPVALDESLALALDQDPNLDYDPAWDAAEALVLKPAVIGLEAAVRIIRRPDRPPVVLSSAFEAGVGLAHLVALAAALDPRRDRFAHGFGTFAWLHRDILRPDAFPDIVRRSNPSPSVHDHVDAVLCDRALRAAADRFCPPPTGRGDHDAAASS